MTKIDKYAAFQVGCSQSIHINNKFKIIVEKGELATSYEEPDDPDMTEDERKLIEVTLHLDAFAVPSTDDLLASFDTIACHVFHHM